MKRTLCIPCLRRGHGSIRLSCSFSELPSGVARLPLALSRALDLMEARCCVNPPRSPRLITFIASAKRSPAFTLAFVSIGGNGRISQILTRFDPSILASELPSTIYTEPLLYQYLYVQTIHRGARTAELVAKNDEHLYVDENEE